jgi:UDP-2,4-diacetamido-2,4,6-trideoxy-beta-L-altropyranose hydrolase
MTDARGTSVHLVTAAGAADGRGHLSRTLALAEALVEAGAHVTIEVGRGSPTEAQAGRLHEIGVPVTGEIAASRQAWVDVVVADLPDPNDVGDLWDSGRLVVFDDRESFRGAAAIVIQPSLPDWHGSARAKRVLAGFAFAPLRPGLRRLIAERRARVQASEVVVCFGGSDPADVSSRLVPPLAEAIAEVVMAGPERSRGRHSLETVAVVGPAYSGALRPGARWTLERDPPDLDRRLAEATVAVVGGGTMKLEVAALGVPALVVAVADDQLAVGPAFAATGACRFLGDGRTIDPTIVATAVADLVGDGAGRRIMSTAGRRAVDGSGAGRIVAAVLEMAQSR